MLYDILDQKPIDVLFAGGSPRESEGLLLAMTVEQLTVRNCSDCSEQAETAAGTELEGTRIQTGHFYDTGKLW